MNLKGIAAPIATAATHDQRTPDRGSSSQRVSARTITLQHARNSGSDTAMRKIACTGGRTPINAVVAIAVSSSGARLTIDSSDSKSAINARALVAAAARLMLRA